MSWLDLHMHSSISGDGEFSPEALMMRCKDAGLKVAALTDHNSVRGIEQAALSAKQYSITLISGIELDCTFQDVNLHVLGYGIDVQNDAYTNIERSIETQEKSAVLTRMQLIEKMGIQFDFEKVMDISQNGIVTGEMIAEIAMQDSRNIHNPLMAPYYPGGERSDNPYVNFYWDFCAKGKGAYVHIAYISLAEAVKTIQKSGGIPILAHPGNNIGHDEDLFKGIIQQGVMGVEAYSSYHTPETTLFYKNLAPIRPESDCGQRFSWQNKALHSAGRRLL